MGCSPSTAEKRVLPFQTCNINNLKNVRCLCLLRRAFLYSSELLVFLFFKTCNHLISKVILVFIAFGSVIKVFYMCTSGYVLLCAGAFCIRCCHFLYRETVMLLILVFLHLLEQNLKGFIGCCHHFLYEFFF